jgi:hypothetical protein
MKDYSLNEEERKNFILNYTKEEETITVNFADGSNYTIPNTESNENKLEGKMIEQVANSKERKHKAISSTGIAIVIIFLFTAASLNGAYWLGNMPQINEIALGLGIAAVVNIPMFAKIIKNNSLLRDIEKNKFFVKNQEVINRGLNNTNVLVNSNVPEKEIITINDMDYSYKYNELKQIVANTERQETFSFDTFPENDVEQEKPKVRSRRR